MNTNNCNKAPVAQLDRAPDFGLEVIGSTPIGRTSMCVKRYRI